MSESQHRHQGVYSASLTPVQADLSIDHARLSAHCYWLLEHGCDGVCLFGTTGEGTAFGVEERLTALAAVRETGFSADRIIMSTATSALADAVQLVRGALAQDVSAILALPPFFLKGVRDDGVYAFFAELIERVADDRFQLYLYHLPALSGVAISAKLAGRLAERYPDTVLGIKDSSGDWANAQTFRQQCPQLDLWMGAEPLLPQAMAAGGIGAISGLSNGVPELVRELCQPAPDSAHTANVSALVELIMRYPFIAALKAMKGDRIDDPEWRNTMPPVSALSESEYAEIIATFHRLAATAA